MKKRSMFQRASKRKRGEKEKCVLCHKKTIINRNMEIEKRVYYVEGAGQLCRECYSQVYPKV